MKNTDHTDNLNINDILGVGKLTDKTKGISLAIIGPLLWGISGSCAQYLFTHYAVNFYWLISMRMFISGSLLVIYGFVLDRHAVMTPIRNPRALARLLLFSIVGMFGSQFTYFMAIKAGSAATATILQFLSPVFIIIYLTVATTTLPRRIDVITILIAIFGTVLLVTHGHFISLAIPASGVFWGICAGVAATIYTLMPGKLLNEYGSIPIVGWAMLFGGVLSIIGFQTWDDFPRFDLQLYLMVGFVVIFGTMCAYLFYLQSLKYIEPTVTSIFSSFEPLSAAIIAVLFLHAIFGAPEIIGTLLILSTVLIQFAANRRIGLNN